MKSLLTIIFVLLIAITSIAGITVAYNDSTFVFDSGNFPSLRAVILFEGLQPRTRTEMTVIKPKTKRFL